VEESKILIGIDLSVASPDVIGILIDDTSEPAVFSEIARTNEKRPDILRMLFDHPHTPDETKAVIAEKLHVLTKPSGQVARVAQPKEARAQNLFQKIQTLSVSERIQLAMKGGREIRGILVKDSNKEVMLSVLENQRITDTEIEMIARSRSVPEEALRRVSKNREWLKNYAIVNALATNPKTPSGIAVTMVNGLKTRDLVILENNRNVPEIVRSAAKRLLIARKPK
jgi:hypothetical protein